MQELNELMNKDPNGVKHIYFVDEYYEMIKKTEIGPDAEGNMNGVFRIG